MKSPQENAEGTSLTGIRASFAEKSGLRRSAGDSLSLEAVMQNDNQTQRAVTPSLIAGATILFIGAALLLGNLGIIQTRDMWSFWPLLLIAAGTANLIDAKGTQGRALSGFLVIVGGLFLLNNLGYVHFGFRTLWPLILIWIGVNFLWNATQSRPGCSVSDTCCVNGFQVFGGSKQRVITEDFKGGEVLAVFGGYEIDLTGSSMSQPLVVFTANAMFGGVKLRVPDTWRVRLDGVAIFGGYEDKTRTPPMSDAANVRHLIIKGMAAFGGVEVSN